MKSEIIYTSTEIFNFLGDCLNADGQNLYVFFKYLLLYFLLII